jgi:HYR domain
MKRLLSTRLPVHATVRLRLRGRHRGEGAVSRSAFTCLVAAVAVVLSAFPSAARADALRLNSIFAAPFSQAACPGGTPDTTSCYPVQASVVLRGLGRASLTWTVEEDLRDLDRNCARATVARLAIVVVDKGEVDLSARSEGCQPYPDPQTLSYTVLGGTGAYTGATGSGSIVFMSHTEPPLPRALKVRLTGSLDVPGLTFDTTAPAFVPIKSLVVRASSVRGARVRFTVRATDAVDGPVAVSCNPGSGSPFRIGKTRVTCSATDGSGNTATSSFTVIVRQRGA